MYVSVESSDWKCPSCGGLNACSEIFSVSCRNTFRRVFPLFLPNGSQGVTRFRWPRKTSGSSSHLKGTPSGPYVGGAVVPRDGSGGATETEEGWKSRTGPEQIVVVGLPSWWSRNVLFIVNFRKILKPKDSKISVIDPDFWGDPKGNRS